MIKKIMTVFLSLMIVLCTSAIAGATQTVTITPELQFNTLSVEVKTTIDDILTMKVYKLNQNSETGEYQIATPNAPAYIGEGYKSSVLNGLNVYEFESFNFSNAQESGKYRILINNTYSQDFSFVNKAHKVPFYRQLETATHDQIEGVLQTAVNNNYVDFDFGGYFGYPAQVKTNINKALEILVLPSLGVAPYEPTDEEVTNFETVLKPEIKRLLAAAELFTAPGTEFGNTVSEYKTELGLDLKLYFVSP